MRKWERKREWERERKRTSYPRIAHGQCLQSVISWRSGVTAGQVDRGVQPPITPKPKPPHTHTQASRFSTIPLGRTDGPTDWWIDWVEMRARLCCQDAQSSPDTFQSSNRAQLTRFFVFEKKKCEKCEKNKKDLKNHSSKTIDCAEFCLASSERWDLAHS